MAVSWPVGQALRYRTTVNGKKQTDTLMWGLKVVMDAVPQGKQTRKKEGSEYGKSHVVLVRCK